MPALTEKQFGAGQQRWISLDSSTAASGLNALTTGGLKELEEREVARLLKQEPELRNCVSSLLLLLSNFS